MSMENSRFKRKGDHYLLTLFIHLSILSFLTFGIYAALSLNSEVKAESKPSVPASKPVSKEKPAPKKTFNPEFELTRLNNLIKLDKENADAFYNRGWLYEYKGDLQKAEQDYTKAVEINKRHVDAYYNRGLVYIKMKKFEQAIKDFSEAIKLKPKSIDAYCNRGNSNLQLNKTDLALKDYDAALKIDPEDADVYYNRAVVYLAKGDEAKAKADFQKAAQSGHNKARKYLGMPVE
ncbi:MAG: tetratricopeptide repeat protein [Deltaproteobacteria bacterium]|nr:tetratricopeptide repeat protein [Deltaproteobacteria bacterium]